MNAKLFKKLVTGTTMMALAASMIGCGQPHIANPTNAPKGSYGTLLLSVNPEIEISYDKNGKVIFLEGMNSDGRKVIDDFDDYEGQTCSETIEELIESIYKNGYFENEIDGHTKNIVLKLAEGSLYPDDAFLETITSSIYATVDKLGLNNQSTLIDEDDLDDQGLINLETARKLLLSQLGLENAEFSEGEYDLDDQIYEFEFVVGDTEYEYEVNAVSGKVNKADRLNNDDWNDWDDDDDDDDKDDIDDDDDDDDIDDNKDDDDDDDKDDDKDDDDDDDQK